MAKTKVPATVFRSTALAFWNEDPATWKDRSFTGLFSSRASVDDGTVTAQDIAEANAVFELYKQNRRVMRYDIGASVVSGLKEGRLYVWCPKLSVLVRLMIPNAHFYESKLYRLREVP